jgi:hypothetical protein
MTTVEFLERMLDATPLPPQGCDVDDLLAAFGSMSAERQLLLDAMSELVVDDISRQLAHSLVAREHAWRAALTAAQQLVKEQRYGVTKLRAYAPAG